MSFVFLGFLLGINIFLFLPATKLGLPSPWGNCEIARRKLFFQSGNIALRLKLADCLIERKQYGLAEAELKELEDVFSKSNSANAFERQQLVIYEAKLRSIDPQLEAKEILFWKKKVLETPRYPDAWVSLALLWYQRGDKEKARLAIAKAQRLDPVREDIKKIAEQIAHPR